MDLVVGATGLIGAEICRLLRGREREVRALVRKNSDPVRLSALKALGVELFYADLKQPASLRGAFTGVHSVVTTASAIWSRAEGDNIPSVDGRGNLDLIAAASAGRVGHFVFVSFAPVTPDFPLQRVKRDAERALAAGSMPWTVLQPAHLLEVWFGRDLGFDPDSGKASLFAAGERPLPWVSSKDVARIASKLIVSGPLERSLTFGGPAALSQREVIAQFERAEGKRFKLEEVPEAALRSQYDTTKDSIEKSLAAFKLACGVGEPTQSDNSCLRGIYDEPLTTVPEFVRTTLEG